MAVGDVDVLTLLELEDAEEVADWISFAPQTLALLPAAPSVCFR